MKVKVSKELEDLISAARLALTGLIDVEVWCDVNEEPASFTRHCRRELKKALKPKVLPRYI